MLQEDDLRVLVDQIRASWDQVINWLTRALDGR